ncbi:MAG: gliding motility-associated C-terminal domain-containing protein [Bacteroidia bacterium]|nr:gliding motility-associated C-terminal domain-containing protein [Bacteroidia bacterium]
MNPGTHLTKPIFRALFPALFLLIFQFQTLHATTVSGTSRGLTIDGNVSGQNGAVAGTNGTSWETDEVFQGFQGIINWYATWDDDNLYLGKVGGNNLQGAIIYLRAEYPGSQYTNIPQNYDGLQPDLSDMGGVNFGAFMKIGYNEFRTWNGAIWSGATANQLFPFFMPVSGADNMEVIIPWDSITNGNGKPLNVRFVLYQVDPMSSNCVPTGPFVYGESPWGTGIGGNGPSVGVNDGQPISSVQPGGCNVATAAASRWWGCYPVIGGVSANGWQVVAPDAGPDYGICESTSTLLNGNVPPAVANGTWSVVGIPSGAPAPVFSNIHDPHAIVSNLTSYGAYIFQWSIDYSSCPATPDTMIITRFKDPPVSNAGPDQSLACVTNSATLAGNNPGLQSNGQGGQGIWAQISGSGQIANILQFNTTVSNLSPGNNAFVWIISNGPCPSNYDTVNIFVPTPPQAMVSPDTGSCESQLFGLWGNNPSTQGAGTTGLWTQAGGPSTVTFSNSSLYNSTISNLNTGVYTLIWTLSSPGCPSTSDTVIYSNFATPLADAGPDQTICANELQATLIGNDPQATVEASATGFWSQLSGPSSSNIVSPNSAITSVSSLEPGVYVYQYNVENGVCPPATDQATLVVDQVTENGFLNVTNSVGDLNNGAATVNYPGNGIPPFTYSFNGGSFDTTRTWTGLEPGIYAIIIEDAQGCRDTLSLTILMDSVKNDLFIATGFSPNGDNVNDTWEIPGLAQFPDAEVELFNVWGGLIFSQKGNYKAWDGRRNGKEMPVGTYYFVIRLNNPGDDQFKGNLTLFR